MRTHAHTHILRCNRLIGLRPTVALEGEKEGEGEEVMRKTGRTL